MGGSAARLDGQDFADIETSGRTQEELAAIIQNALRTLDRCPERGFEVTVYGTNPWTAMLMIKPEAGPVADAALWRERVRAMAVRLRQDYDLIES
jgi:hypothetical protein